MSTSSSFTPSNSPPSSDSGEMPPPVGQVGQPQHVDDINVVIEQPGNEGVERLTTSSDSNMDTASEGRGRLPEANANQEGVNGNGQRTPRQDRLTSTLTAYDRLQQEADFAREGGMKEEWLTC